MLDLGRDTLGQLESALSREWLVTNGIGGYAAGTIPGVLTRRYHGLLLAALQPPVGRALLVTKFDETATYDGLDYALYANEWEDGSLEPNGYIFLERFHLEGTTPVWTYALADALLEKRIWMQPGHNTTYIHYTLRRGSRPIDLEIKAFVNFRDHHGSTRAPEERWALAYTVNGVRVTPAPGVPPYYLFSNRATLSPDYEWTPGYYLAVEAYRGLDELDDNLFIGTFEAALPPGHTLTLLATTDPTPNLDGGAAFQARRAYEAALIQKAHAGQAPAWAQHLTLAADQFIVRRASAREPEGHSVIAGYPWFGDWGRDTMIALPGLTLATGRPEIARSILRTFAQFVDQGMLPNRFPDDGEPPEYNTGDATLWYFEAIRAYHAATGDDALLEELFPILEDILAWHARGTRYQIHLDPEDGLLSAGEPGVQLTWMDAKAGDWVITPRTGKPVEINALWYNAQRSMAAFARHLGRPSEAFEQAAEKTRRGFARFWNEARGCCFDVLDGPAGPDDTIRPNQLFAVSLFYDLLTPGQQKSLLEVCTLRLYTSHGLRSLDPEHPAFTGTYGGDQRERDAAYHQGAVWGWLIGPFVAAHLKVHKDPAQALTFLEPLIRNLDGHCMGSISEIFEGYPPFTPRGCFAQAWSVAELLRLHHLINS